MSPAHDRPTVGLCMIVRDEQAVLRRCLESVLAVTPVDSWTLVDTGSRDSTITLAYELLAPIPGKVHRLQWTDDFSAARNRALELARPTADWLLLLDADMTLHRTGRVNLEGDGVMLRCSSGHEPMSGTWWSTVRMIRSAAPWAYTGVVHEALTGPPDLQVSASTGMQILHHEDGANRVGRLDRDEKALNGVLAGDPTDARSWYYLGQTLLEANNPEGAHGAFTRCIEFTRSPEEAYVAQWYRGHCLLAQGLPDEAVADWLDATTNRPSRLEAFAAALVVLRTCGRIEAARELLDALGPTPPQPEDLLHIRPALYAGQLQEEQERAERRLAHTAPRA